MTREQASSIIAGSRRFQVSRGRIIVRDAEVAAMIAAVRAERRPAFGPTRGTAVSN